MRHAATAILLCCVAGTLQAQFGESITVQRILVDVRVTDGQGEPIEGLTPEDFTITIARKPAVVESVTWFNDLATGPVDPSWMLQEDATPQRPPGRLFVLFIQTDFARVNSRVTGQMHFRRYAEEFVQALAPDDRVAVFSFDSHLKFRRDFTSDKNDVAEAIRESIRIDHPPPPPTVPRPSLASKLDREKMKRTTSSEAALLHIANALSLIGGPKTLVLIGWGLGERAGGSVQMKREWPAARRALDAARTSIFALDTSVADYHDLEIGMQAAAKETGGFYAKTHQFAEGAIERLQRTLSGHYEIEIRPAAALRVGTHDLEVRVKRRGATVLAPGSVIVRE